MRGFLALRICVWKCPDETYQIPDVFVGFHSSKFGHATQSDAVLHNPEQLLVGILLDLDRSEVCRSRVHPSSRVGWYSSGVAEALQAFGTEEFVTFVDACSPVCGGGRDASTTGSSNQKMLGLGCHDCLRSGRLGQRTQVELRSHYAAHQHQSEKCDRNP